MSAFDALHHDDRAVQPDRRFAARLKTRLTDALVATVDLPERSTTMIDPTTTATATTTGITTSKRPAATGAATGALHPYLAVGDAAAAIDWYTTVFDARATVRYVGADGRIGHGELEIGGGKLMLADPFGHQWMVQTVTADPTIGEIEEGFGSDFTIVTPDRVDRPVEVGYITMPFDDTAAARRFYGELFGWLAEDGHLGSEYAHVGNTELPIGMTPGGVGGATLYFRVDDADRYAGQVVALGGRVLSRSDRPSGVTVECLDDQGGAFTLWQPAEGH